MFYSMSMAQTYNFEVETNEFSTRAWSMAQGTPQIALPTEARARTLRRLPDYLTIERGEAISDAARAALGHMLSDVQLLPVLVRSRRASKQFFVLNPIDRVDAIDRERREATEREFLKKHPTSYILPDGFITFRSFHIDADKTGGRPLFLVEGCDCVIVSDEFRAGWGRAGLSGVEFLRFPEDQY